MPNNAQRSTRGDTRAAGRSSNTTAAHRSGKGVQPLLTAEQTEGVVMRMAAVLSADAAKSTTARAQHIAYVGGALALAVSLGVLSDDRALEVRRAAIALVDAAALPAREYRADPAFAVMVSAVRKKGGASLDAPLPMAELDRTAAVAMLGRLMAAGIVGGPDAAGLHRIIAGEC
jgi:hypothetical protein